MTSEFERIAQLHRIFGPAPQGVSLGIGDDAAVISLPYVAQAGSQLVWTVDSSVEGVHFRCDLVSWRDVGWRSLMAAASDLGAMAARPVGALSALMLSDRVTDEQLFELAQGQHEAAAALGTAVVGGNLSRASETSVTTTVLGVAEHSVHRNGAKPGQVVAIAGEVGFAAAGLRLLLRDGQAWQSDDENEQLAVTKWRRPVARLNDGLRAASVATAMIDVSDGVAQDAGHIAKASDVRIELDPDLLVDPRLEAVARSLNRSALELVLNGGEDYALIITVAEHSVPEGFRVVGRCIEGQGVCLKGECEALPDAGHDHFRK